MPQTREHGELQPLFQFVQSLRLLAQTPTRFLLLQP